MYLKDKATDLDNRNQEFIKKLWDKVLNNDSQAIEWFIASAEHGNPDSQYFLAIMYQDGTGVQKNDKHAIKMYKKAADQGLACAQRMFSAMTRE